MLRESSELQKDTLLAEKQKQQIWLTGTFKHRRLPTNYAHETDLPYHRYDLSPVLHVDGFFSIRLERV